MHTPDERVYRQRGVRQTDEPEFRPLTLPRGAYERVGVSNLFRANSSLSNLHGALFFLGTPFEIAVTYQVTLP